MEAERRPSFDFFAGTNGFAWSAGYTAIRCYTAGRGG